MREFKNGEKEASFDGAYGTSVPEPERHEPTPKERAQAAKTIADNLVTYSDVVSQGVTDMRAAVAGQDHAAWTAGETRAHAGLEQITAIVDVALTAKNDATDGAARARLAGVETRLQQARALVDSAPAAPEIRAPVLTCTDALLAVLLPAQPGGELKAAFEAAERAVATVFRQMTFSDILAFQAIWSQHKDHEIARRFARFGESRRKGLLAIFEDSKIRSRARAREAQRSSHDAPGTGGKMPRPVASAATENEPSPERQQVRSTDEPRAADQARPSPSNESTPTHTPAPASSPPQRPAAKIPAPAAASATATPATAATAQARAITDDDAPRGATSAATTAKTSHPPVGQRGTEPDGAAIAARVLGTTYEGPGRFRVSAGRRQVGVKIQRGQTISPRLRRGSGDMVVLEMPSSLGDAEFSRAVAEQLRILQEHLAREPSEAGGGAAEAAHAPADPDPPRTELDDLAGHAVTAAAHEAEDDGYGQAVQRKATHELAHDSAAVANIARRGVEGGGGKLPHLEQIQPAFGHHDVAGVTAHHGPQASQATRELGARAYAHGNSVAFDGAPDLHTAAHEAAHTVQQKAGVQLKGGVDQPGDAYERHADAVADAVVAGQAAEPLLDQMAGAGPARAPSAVQRKTDESTPASPANPGHGIERYLGANQVHVWNVVGDHARSVHFPDPCARLTWINQKAFVHELLMQLEANIGDFTPVAKLDEILYPSNAARTVGPMLPSTDAWSPPLGLAIAQALQIATVSSLHRLGPRYLAVADSSGAAGEGVMNPGALVYSMPIDRYVGAAMCAPRLLTIEPPDAKTAAKAKGKPTGLRATKLAWEGARDPHLWNWVRATDPADATAEEVAATLWTVTDHHGETNAAFNAYLLAAAPPLFGIPKKFAIKNPNASQYAPAHALTGEDNVQAELVDIAKSSPGDDIALHQSSAGRPNHNAAPAEAPPELSRVLAMVGDCKLQLDFVTAEVARWGLADHVAPAVAFVARKAHELATVDAAALTDWNRVVSGQRDRLHNISGAIHNLASTAEKLGVKHPMAAEAAPVREILELLATAAGTSHLGQTSEATLRQALELQAGLNARAVQATERELEGAHLDFHATMGTKGAKGAAAYSPEVADLQDRSRRLQTTMINGGEADAAEIDEVTLRSGEVALRERVLGAIHSTFELQEAATAAKDGIAAHIAMLFSGKFRNLESVCQHIRERVAPVQNELMATEQQIRDEERAGVGTPAQKAKHRATRRAVLAKAHEKFAKIATDEDLQHFFREGPKVVQNQQFRTACVNAAALIGIAVLAAATGGAAAEFAGGMAMEASGAATVAELSSVARIGIGTMNVAADSAVNAVGQTAIQGGSLPKAFVENLMMSFASTVLFGTIARASADTARLEGREAMTWAKADRFAQKAFVASREAGAIAVHTVWGAAIGYVAHRVVGGHEPSPMEAREWMLQGASVAIGRGVHKALGARMPGLERLAKRSDEAKRLVLDANQLERFAGEVEQSKDAASAVELLDRRTKLLREEIEAIEQIVAKAGDAGGELGKMRKDLEHQIHESNGHAMLETKLHLLGLEELVPGALWKGSHAQIDVAVREARDNGGKVSPQDPHTKRWALEVEGRQIQIQEVAGESPAILNNGSAGAPKNTIKRVTLTGNDADATDIAKVIPPKPEVLDVILHGGDDDFVVKTDRGDMHIDHRALATYIKKSGAKYQRIRLLSCRTGNHPKSVAQHLANKLGVIVEAPSDKLFIHGDGSMTIGPTETRDTGRWVEYRPVKSEFRYQTAGEPPPPTLRERAAARGNSAERSHEHEHVTDVGDEATANSGVGLAPLHDAPIQPHSTAELTSPPAEHGERRSYPDEVNKATDVAAKGKHTSETTPLRNKDASLDGAWATAAELGDVANATTIAHGTVTMELHPNYETLLAEARADAFVVVFSGEPHVEVTHIVDESGTFLEVRKELHLMKGMRYLDLEHEMGHIEQLQHLGLPTHKLIRTAAGVEREAVANELAGILTTKQNSVAEYENRLVEYIRLAERNVEPRILSAHAAGVIHWRNRADADGLRRSKSSLLQWAKEHFANIPELEDRARRLGLKLGETTRTW